MSKRTLTFDKIKERKAKDDERKNDVKMFFYNDNINILIHFIKSDREIIRKTQKKFNIKILKLNIL